MFDFANQLSTGLNHQSTGSSNEDPPRHMLSLLHLHKRTRSPLVTRKNNYLGESKESTI